MHSQQKQTAVSTFFVLKQSKMQINISIELEMKTQAERKENKTN